MYHSVWILTLFQFGNFIIKIGDKQLLKCDHFSPLPCNAGPGKSLPSERRLFGPKGCLPETRELRRRAAEFLPGRDTKVSKTYSKSMWLRYWSDLLCSYLYHEHIQIIASMTASEGHSPCVAMIAPVFPVIIEVWCLGTASWVSLH